MHSNTLIAMLCLLGFGFAGCSSPHASPGEAIHTLSGNPSLPDDEIRVFYTDEQWALAKDMPYDGFVVLRGQVSTDQTIRNLRVVDAYPDGSRDGEALLLAQRARLTATTVGGRTRPAANVYVIFYETQSDPDRALVFAQQLDGAAFTGSIGGTRFIQIYTY